MFVVPAFYIIDRNLSNLSMSIINTLRTQIAPQHSYFKNCYSGLVLDEYLTFLK